MIRRAHKIRLNPTPGQEAYFYRAAGIARFTWNWALEQYQAAKQRGEKVDWNEFKKEFRERIDAEAPFVREVTKCAPEQAFADLRQAINTYYQVKNKNPKSKLRFPGFRKRGKKVGGFGLANDHFSLEGQTVRVPKLGEVNLAEPLRFGSSRILSGRIKFHAGRWYLVVTVELAVQPVGATGGSVGIDFGLSRLATLSTGEVIETQAHFLRNERKLKLAQRSLSRKRKGSRNRAKAKLRVARCHARITNQRRDFLHKRTTEIVCAFAIVCVEDLCLKGMAQTRLAKSVHDASIGEAVRQLEYKATVVQKVGRYFPSSKRCHQCSHVHDGLTLSDRVWRCSQCGAEHNRDVNAAINIEMEGRRLLAGSGYVGATPVEFAVSTLSFGLAQAAD